MPWRGRLQGAAACLGLCAYAGLSHYCNSVTGCRDLGAAMALAPLTGAALILAWRFLSVPAALLSTGTLAWLLYGLWPVLTRSFSLFSLIEETGIYLLLGATFGRSLLPKQVALCTRLANMVHGPLSSLELRYTRRVTVAWTIFFFAISAGSILLFVLAPLRIWSIFINFCGLPLVGIMFMTEYLIRRRVLPGEPRAGLLTTVRVYLANSR